MPEDQHKPKSVWWMAGLSIGGVVLLLLGAVWIWLPDIAAFGLRFDATRQVSRNTLVWLGPRALKQIFLADEYHVDAYIRSDLIHDLGARAEEDPRVRRIVVRDFTSPDVRDFEGVTLLHWAAAWGWERLAVALIEEGASVNARDEADWTPLFEAAGEGRYRLAELLISEGADVNVVGAWGSTPLHKAVAFGHTACARLLISHGAAVDVRSKTGSTPLHEAASHSGIESCEICILNGADVNARNNSGRTPLDCACSREISPVPDFLRKHGAKTGAELDAEKAASSAQQ